MKSLASPRWLLRHAAAVVLVAAFLALGRWQIGRAAGGNPLSFGYSIEWPFFALFVIFIWIREMRAELHAARSPYGTPEPGVDASEPGVDGPEPGVDGPEPGVDGPEPGTDAPERGTGEPAGVPGVTAFDVAAALARRAAQDRAGAPTNRERVTSDQSPRP